MSVQLHITIVLLPASSPPVFPPAPSLPPSLPPLVVHHRAAAEIHLRSAVLEKGQRSSSDN